MNAEEEKRDRRPERWLLCAGVFLGWTIAAGGIDPTGRVFALGLVALAALAAIRDADAVPVNLALFLPAFAALASLPSALIPGLGYEETTQLFFFAVAANALSADAESAALAKMVLFASIALAASVHAESLGNVMLLGRPGLGLGAAGFLAGAGVTSVALAASLPVLWETRAALPRSFAALAALIIVAAIILTESRTGLVAAGAGMAWPFLRMPPASRRRAFGVGAVIVAALALAFLPKFIARLDPHYLTNAQRLSMIGGVGRAFLARPLAGYGPWSFPILGQRFLAWPKWELHPHNVLLRTTFESGFVGLLAWSALIVVLAAGARRKIAAPRAWAPGAVLAIFGGSMTDDMFWIPSLAFLFFLAASAFAAGPRYRVPIYFAAPLLLILGFAAAILPALQDRAPGMPLAPLCQELDAAVIENKEPDYRGWTFDPAALRIAGYADLASGDTPRALALFRSALGQDPHLIFGPHTLDLAWTLGASGDTPGADAMLAQTRAIAPALAAWFLHETAPVELSFVDRHYGIEYPDPFAIAPAMVAPDGDPLSWRHYRYEGAQALVAGDTARARALLDKAHVLALREYGTDAVLCRLYASVAPEYASELLARAEHRRDPASPWRIFAPMIYRHDIHSTGENAPWREQSR